MFNLWFPICDLQFLIDNPDPGNPNHLEGPFTKSTLENILWGKVLSETPWIYMFKLSMF